MSSLKAMQAQRAERRRSGAVHSFVSAVITDAEAAAVAARYFARLRSKAHQKMDEGYAFARTVIGYSTKLGHVLEVSLEDIEDPDALVCDRLIAALERLMHFHGHLLDDVRTELALGNPQLFGLDKQLQKQQDALVAEISMLEAKMAKSLTRNTLAVVEGTRETPSASALELAQKVVAARSKKQVVEEQWASGLASSVAGVHD